ncbi:MAG: GNAT family N-acetyltransferase [bacterium]
MPKQSDNKTLSGAVAKAKELRFSVAQRRPCLAELDCINHVISGAINTWRLPERVLRISVPLYQYSENDLLHMNFFIAETGDSKIVGLAALEGVEEKECRGDLRTLLLHGLYVHPAYHCRGVGSMLMESVEVFAHSNGVDGLLVRAQIDAQPFFENQDFVRMPVENESRDYPYRYWKSISR